MRPNLPVVGIGHSIGATTLLALAGAQLWMGPGQRLDIKVDERFKRLVLMTPPTGFFQAPGALDGIYIPLQVWAGTDDVMTPPAQAELLRTRLENRVPIDLRSIHLPVVKPFSRSSPPRSDASLLFSVRSKCEGICYKKRSFAHIYAPNIQN